MFGLRRWTIRVAACAAVGLALAVPANAGSMSDLSVDSLTFKYTPTPGSEVFKAFSSRGGSHIAWTQPDGSNWTTAFGDFHMQWRGRSSSGKLTIESATTGDLLKGTVTDFLFSGPQSFVAHVTLGTKFLDLAPGSYLEVAMTATSLVFDTGTGKYLGSGHADVYAVPEPATIALLALGGVIVAVRRRR